MQNGVIWPHFDINRSIVLCFLNSNTVSILAAADQAAVTIQLAICLADMYAEITKDRWPSQRAIDQVVGLSALLGDPHGEIDKLRSALTQ